MRERVDQEIGFAEGGVEFDGRGQRDRRAGARRAGEKRDVRVERREQAREALRDGAGAED